MDANILIEGVTHSTGSRRDSVPLFALLKPHTVIGECHMRRDKDEIHGAIYIEREFEWSACDDRCETNGENGAPAGLSIYPQANGSCNEAWVPRISRFTAISIGSAGWFCTSPENRRHSPSASCCGAAIVHGYAPPRFFGRGTRRSWRGCG